MQLGDKIIYQQFKGAMVMVNEPTMPFNTNFVITWKGMDWSGFRTLENCVRQFPELMNHRRATEDHFQVVERL